MDVFLKASAAVLITVILNLTVSKQSKDMSILIVVAGCCAVLIAALTYLKPIVDFINKLKKLIGFEQELINVILKAVGIGILSEITNLICVDSGNASLGRSLQILATVVIIWISLPIFNQLLDLLEQVLGTI